MPSAITGGHVYRPDRSRYAVERLGSQCVTNTAPAADDRTIESCGDYRRSDFTELNKPAADDRMIESCGDRGGFCLPLGHEPAADDRTIESCGFLGLQNPLDLLSQQRTIGRLKVAGTRRSTRS